MGRGIRIETDEHLWQFRGTSMWPVLREGDLAVVQPVDCDLLRIGDCIAFCKDGDDHGVIHRIVGLTPTIRTKGDRLPKEDDWSVTSDAIQGRVVAYVRCGKRIPLAGGWWGALTGAAMQWLARLDPARNARLGRCGKMLRTILAPLTRCWLGRAQMIRFLSSAGRHTHRLVLGQRTLATFDDDHQVWKVEWPLRLWIDPARLSCVGRRRIREGSDEPVPGSHL